MSFWLHLYLGLWDTAGCFGPFWGAGSDDRAATVNVISQFLVLDRVSKRNSPGLQNENKARPLSKTNIFLKVHTHICIVELMNSKCISDKYIPSFTLTRGEGVSSSSGLFWPFLRILVDGEAEGDQVPLVLPPMGL